MDEAKTKTITKTKTTTTTVTETVVNDRFLGNSQDSISPMYPDNPPKYSEKPRPLLTPDKPPEYEDVDAKYDPFVLWRVRILLLPNEVKSE